MGWKGEGAEVAEEWVVEGATATAEAEKEARRRRWIGRSLLRMPSQLKRQTYTRKESRRRRL